MASLNGTYALLVVYLPNDPLRSYVDGGYGGQTVTDLWFKNGDGRGTCSRASSDGDLVRH